LGNVIILAKFTSKIATYCGNGKGLRRWANMEKGLFLNWINIFSNQFAIDQRIECSAAVFPYPTNSPLALFDFAPVRTKIAIHLAIRLPVIKHGFMNGHASP
jgi:hypothetical protein